MIPLLIVVFLIGWLLSRPAAATIRTALRNALGVGFATVHAGALDAVYCAWATLRAAAWTLCAYLGLLLLAHFIGNQWFWLAVLVLGVTFSVAGAWVLHTLRYPAAEIAAKLAAAGAWVGEIPLTPTLPDWANPAKAGGTKLFYSVPLAAVHALLAGFWLLFSLPLLGLAGVIKGLGGLATVAEKTMRWLSRAFAMASLTLLFLTAVSLVDFRLETRILDTWTLALLALLAALGITMGVLAAGNLEDRHQNVPATASLTGILTGAILLGLLWAHFDPRGSLEMVRSFRNAGDNLRTYARIGNDAGQITNKAYWRLRETTVLRPCPNCTVKDGQLNGTVGDPVEHATDQPLISMATEQPVEMDGVLWMRVFLPYDWEKPVLGYNLKPQAVWIAPKDYLAGAAKPVDLAPNAPGAATGAGLRQAALASNPLLLVFLTPLLLGTAFLLLGGVGSRIFGARPNPAAAGGAPIASAAHSNGGGHGHHPLLWISAMIIAAPWIMFLLFGAVNMAATKAHINWNGPGLPYLIGTLMAISGAGLIIAAVVLAITSRRGTAVILLLLAFLLFGARSAFAEGPRKPLTTAVSAPAGPKKPPMPETIAAAVATPPMLTTLPAEASATASVSPSISRPDFATNLAIMDEELTRYPELAEGRPIILALVKNESDWDPDAKNPASSASGLMQLIGATQRHYGVADPFDPRQNVKGGLAFLADLHRRYSGDWPKMLLAYAWGPENVPPETGLATSMAAADRASPESSQAVRRVLARASGQMPTAVFAAARANHGIGATVRAFGSQTPPPGEASGVKLNGGWEITAYANVKTPTAITLPAGRYQVLVASPDCIVWDTAAPRVCPNAKIVHPDYLADPQDFPVQDIGVGKPVLITDIGYIGLDGVILTLDLGEPMKIQGVIQNNREKKLKDSLGHWIIHIIPKEG